MTKEITKAFILQQLQDTLGLRELEPAKFLFEETVSPVYDIRSHLQKRSVLYEVVSVTSGNTGFLYWTVPEDERWFLRGYNIFFLAAGAYEVTGVYIDRTEGGYLYLDMKKNQTASYAINMATPVILDPGDKIYAYVDTYVSTADLGVRADVVKEKIR